MFCFLSCVNGMSKQRSIIQKVRLWLTKLDKRQRKSTMQTVKTDEQHVCANCETAFVGRFCPQCGLSADNQKVTLKTVVQGFLDVWGFGSRPMLRTIHELFWRPGYMIRDYLHGHQPLYFPPFKMLIIMTLIFAIVASIRVSETSLEQAFIYGDVFQRYGAPAWVISVFGKIDTVLLWLNRNPAYSAISAGIFYIIASWLVFRRRMSFIEVFISQLYISSQMQIVGTFWVLITGNWDYYNMPPFAVPFVIGIPLLCYDYFQLYELRLWPTIWRTVLTFVLTLLMMLIVGGLPILMVKYL